MGADSMLRRFREAKGLSQRQLYEMSGVSADTISRIERGQEPGLDDARAIARALEVPLDFLWPVEAKVS